MKLFSRQIAELETQNRILTDAARKGAAGRRSGAGSSERSERAFLSNRIAQLEELNRLLEAERAFYSKRAGELEEHESSTDRSRYQICIAGPI